MLTDVQRQEFDTWGFIILRGFLPPEDMRAYTDAFDATLQTIVPPERWSDERGVVGAMNFFQKNPGVYHRLLDDERVLEVVEDILGPDYVFTTSEGARRYADTNWHHDDLAPEGQIHLKVVFYLDPMGADPGSLCLLPGSHHADYRERVEGYGRQMLSANRDVPGTYPIASDPGDMIVFNVKTYHGAFAEGVRRRAIYINFLQRPKTSLEEAHVEWLNRKDGGYYTPPLFEDAPPSRLRMTRFLKERCYDKTA